MDVRCPQCQTLYELDDQRVAARTVTLKCTTCTHVFKFSKSDPVPENKLRWMVRSDRGGDIVYVPDFLGLHQLLMKREITQDDQISRTGGNWTKLGDIGEFTPVFQVIESISNLAPEALKGRSDISSIAQKVTDDDEPTTPGIPVEDTGPRERVRTSLQYGAAPRPSPQRAEDITRRVGPGGPPPPDEMPNAPALPSSSGEREHLETWSMDAERPPEPAARSGVGLVVVVSVLLLGGAAALVYTQRPELLGISATAPDVPATSIEEPPRPPTDISGTVQRALSEATEASLTAVQRRHAELWTQWHLSASEPFYKALDDAYAAADEASAVDELEDKLAKARGALERGQLSAAQQLYTDVLSKEPSNSAGLTGLGWTFLAMGDAQRAAGQFRLSIGSNPSFADAYIGLGSAERSLGNLQAARDAYDAYLGRYPKGPKASIASYQLQELRKQLGQE